MWMKVVCLVIAATKVSALQLRALPYQHAASTCRPAPPRAHIALALDAATFVVDPNFNLAAGAALLGTVCGALEDLKGADGEYMRSRTRAHPPCTALVRHATRNPLRTHNSQE